MSQIDLKQIECGTFIEARTQLPLRHNILTNEVGLFVGDVSSDWVPLEARVAHVYTSISPIEGKYPIPFNTSDAKGIHVAYLVEREGEMHALTVTQTGVVLEPVADRMVKTSSVFVISGNKLVPFDSPREYVYWTAEGAFKRYDHATPESFLHIVGADYRFTTKKVEEKVEEKKVGNIEIRVENVTQEIDEVSASSFFLFLLVVLIITGCVLSIGNTAMGYASFFAVLMFITSVC